MFLTNEYYIKILYMKSRQILNLLGIMKSYFPMLFVLNIYNMNLSEKN